MRSIHQLKNEVVKNGFDGLCVKHNEDFPQIKDLELSNNFEESILEKNAQSDTHIFDPSGSRYIIRAFLYQIRGIRGIESLDEGEKYKIEVTFKNGERQIIENLNNTDILQALDFQWLEPAYQEVAFAINIYKSEGQIQANQEESLKDFEIVRKELGPTKGVGIIYGFDKAWH